VKRSNFTEQSQEILRLLCNTKVHYRVHKSLPVVPIMSQLNPIVIQPIYYRATLILTFHIPQCFRRGIYPAGFPNEKCVCISHFAIHTSCPAHLILHDMITLISGNGEGKVVPALN